MEQLRILQLMQHVGLARLLGLRPPMPLQTLSPEVQQQINASSLKSTAGDALYEEVSAYQLDFAESLNATPLRADIPLLVLLRGQVEGPPDQDAAGKAANADLARRSTQGQVVVAEGSGHFIQLDRPDLVIDAIHQIVESVRTER